MKEPEVIVLLDRRQRDYEPGQLLSGSYRWDAGEEKVRRVEVSVMWRTEGKGDEDFGVHFFDHYSVEEGDEVGPQASAHFTTQLPNSPLSYHGVAVSIQWMVRVRVFLQSGKEAVGERPFRLGHVPPGREVMRPKEGAAAPEEVESQ
jgi:hypothetical protein